MLKQRGRRNRSRPTAVGLVVIVAGMVPGIAPLWAGPKSADQIPRAVLVEEVRVSSEDGAGTVPSAGLSSSLLLSLGASDVVQEDSGHGSKDVLGTRDDESTQRWRLRLDYFQGTDNGFGSIFGGDLDTISQNGVAVHLGYLLKEDLWDLPLDLIVQGSVMWHDEKDWQNDFLHYTASLKAEWTSFPWNEHVQTRLGFATGWSYANKIPFAEVLNRDSTSSKHFLHYLEPSLSLNCGDLFRLIQLDRLFGDFDSSALDHCWLVGSIYHRSGAWGFYGEDNNGDDVGGASNFLAIGIQAEF